MSSERAPQSAVPGTPGGHSVPAFLLPPALSLPSLQQSRKTAVLSWPVPVPRRVAGQPLVGGGEDAGAQKASAGVLRVQPEDAENGLHVTASTDS